LRKKPHKHLKHPKIPKQPKQLKQSEKSEKSNQQDCQDHQDYYVHPDHENHTVHNDKDTSCAYLDEEICIEAKVKVNPEVLIGHVTVESLESHIEPHAKLKNCHDECECTVIVSQLIRVKIPIHFSAKAEAKKSGVSCKPYKTHDPEDECC